MTQEDRRRSGTPANQLQQIDLKEKERTILDEYVDHHYDKSHPKPDGIPFHPDAQPMMA